LDGELNPWLEGLFQAIMQLYPLPAGVDVVKATQMPAPRYRAATALTATVGRSLEMWDLIVGVGGFVRSVFWLNAPRGGSSVSMYSNGQYHAVKYPTGVSQWRQQSP
jgi:hypothetical protein